MALNDIVLNPGVGGSQIGVDTIGGSSFEVVKQAFGSEGTVTLVDAANPLPVTDAVAEAALTSLAAEDFATETTLLALLAKLVDGLQKTQVVDGSGNVIGATANALDVNIKSGNDVTIVASDLEIGGVEIKNGTDDTRAVVTPANALKVDGSAVTQPVSAAALPLPAGAATAANQQTNALTDAQLRATPISISGTITATGGLTDAQLRATAVPVSNASLPLPTGASTETTLAAILAKLIAAPATEATQTSGNTTLASILAKIVASPALESTQVASNTTLTSIDGKLTSPTAILNGKTTVTTSGTRVVLAASTACKSVTIKALSTNTGIIYVGNSTVAAANGFQLSAGDTISLDISNLNTVNIDSSVNAESVTYIGVN